MLRRRRLLNFAIFFVFLVVGSIPSFAYIGRQRLERFGLSRGEGSYVVRLPGSRVNATETGMDTDGDGEADYWTISIGKGEQAAKAEFTWYPKRELFLGSIILGGDYMPSAYFAERIWQGYVYPVWEVALGSVIEPERMHHYFDIDEDGDLDWFARSDSDGGYSLFARVGERWVHVEPDRDDLILEGEFVGKHVRFDYEARSFVITDV